MQNQEQQSFFVSLGISTLLHIVFACLFIFGIPSFRTPPVQKNNAIVFEMLSVDDVVNVRNQNQSSFMDPEAQEAKRVKKPVPAETQPQQEKPKEIKEEEAPKPLPKEVAKEAEIVPKKKSEPEKKSPEKKKPEPVKPKTEKPKPKRVAKKEEDVIDSILKSLEKESEGQEVNSQNRSNTNNASEGKFAKGNNYDDNLPLSVTEKLLIRQQIEKNWTRPVGIADLGIKVVLSLKLKLDGTITDIVITDTTCPLGVNRNSCDLVVESALRAVRKTSQIKNLRPDRYDTWEKLDLSFTPEGGLGL